MKISEPEIGALRYIKGVGPKRSLIFQKMNFWAFNPMRRNGAEKAQNRQLEKEKKALE